MPTKRLTKQHGKPTWEVELGGIDGGRRRKYFKTEDEADKEIEKFNDNVKQIGEYLAHLEDLDRQRIVITLQEIERDAPGKSIGDIWSEWKASKHRVPVVSSPMPYSKVVAEWRKRKLAAGIDSNYVEIQCRTLFKQFGEGRSETNIHEISADTLNDWMNARWKNLSTLRTNRMVFSGLWEVAVVKKWCVENIIKSLEPLGKIKRDIRIYPNQTVIHLLAAALHNEATEKLLGPLVAGFFGCMRPEEVESKKAIRNKKPIFGWPEIDLKHARATVSAEVAKTGDTRVVRLQPTAVKWYELAKKLGCEFPPVNERRLREYCCALIGLDDWIRDGLRKCCATHLRAHYKADYEVILDMGNSIRVLLEHYAALQVPPDVSADYWNITPERVKAYMKTSAWTKFLKSAAGRPLRRVSEDEPEPSASETSTSEN